MKNTKEGLVKMRLQSEHIPTEYEDIYISKAKEQVHAKNEKLMKAAKEAYKGYK